MKRMRPWLLLGAPTWLALLAGCRTTAPLDTVDTFSHFETVYFSALFRWSPSYGTLAGFHEYDAALENWSAAAHRQRIAELQALRQRWTRLDRAAFTPAQALDAEWLGAQLEAELFDLAEWQTWRKNPMAYVGRPGEAIDALMKRDFAPAAVRLGSVTARLRQMPTLLEAMRANVSNPPREFTEMALSMAQGSVEFFRATVPDWAAANHHNGEDLNALRVAAAQGAQAMESAAY